MTVSRVANLRSVSAVALTRALRETSGQSVLFSQAVADRVGMSPADLESLDMLMRHGPMTAGQLAELTGLTSGAITGLVDRLERRGYAKREPHPSDRRSVMVRAISENAERDLGPSYAGMEQAMNAFCAGYSEEDLGIIAEFLTRATVIAGEQIALLRSETARRE